MINWTNVFELYFWGIITIAIWEFVKYVGRWINAEPPRSAEDLEEKKQ